MSTQSVVQAMRLGAPLSMQFMQSLADLESDPLSALATGQVGDMRLRDARQISNLVLVQAGRQKFDDDFFPHDAYDSICCCPDQQQPLVQHLLLGKQNDGMEIEEVRRLRLRQWIDSDPVSLGDVEKWCNHYSKLAAEGDGTLSPTYIRQLVPKRGNPSRNIGERVARRLERIVGKPKGALDEEMSGEQQAVTVDHIQPRVIADNATDNIVAVDVVQNAVAGVLDAFGLRYEDLVGDVREARERIASALHRPAVEDVIARTTIRHRGEVRGLPVSRATQVHHVGRYPVEVSPERAEGGEGEQLQERRI